MNMEKPLFLKGPFEVTEETRERRPRRFYLLTGRNIAAPFDRNIRTNQVERRLPRTSTPRS